MLMGESLSTVEEGTLMSYDGKYTTKIVHCTILCFIEVVIKRF